ncbi:MAG: hypothetical protein F6K58_24005 [Symploca sp. SIO2E9]|nr:hypothetical protein [Symploca sp. SIO2E9]
MTIPTSSERGVPQNSTTGIIEMASLLPLLLSTEQRMGLACTRFVNFIEQDAKST